MIELVEEAQAKYAEMMASYQLEIEEANSQKLVRNLDKTSFT